LALKNEENNERYYNKQLKLIKQKYEDENSELINRLATFTDELEELKKNYKDKNMKLYNLVLQLEKVQHNYLSVRKNKT
jgi:seryl-tRNA synthetase